MLSSDARARLTVILVGARNPSNIGAAARALQDFGFSDLRLVNTFAAPFEAAQIEASQIAASQAEANPLDPANPAAVASGEVMRNARRFDTLADAIADCTLIVGTTAIGLRDLTQPVLPLQQAAPRILNTLTPPPSEPWALDPGPSSLSPGPSSPRVALLFGSEKTGLTNEQLSHCQLLTTIPLYAPSAAAPAKPVRHLSMNLGQSVAVCLYELTRDGFEGSVDLPVLHQAPATAADRERLTQLLLDVLHATGYTRRFPGNVTDPLIRQLALQLGDTHREAMTWMGILRQVLWREKTDAHNAP